MAAAQAADPALVYAALVGGTGTDNITATAVDAQGNVYVTGTTTSSNIPNSRSLGGETEINASSDSGATFQPVSDTPFRYVYSLAADPKTPGTLFAGGYDTIYKSTDNGRTWHAGQAAFPPGSFPPPLPAAAIAVSGVTAAIVVDPLNPNNVYAGRQPGGVVRSTDSGQTWTLANAGLGASEYVTSLAVDPFQPSNLLLATFNGLFRSTDGAGTWAQVSLPVAGYPVRVLFDPLARGTAWLQDNGALLKSTDGGQTWTTKSNNSLATLFAIDPTNSNVLYGNVPGGLARSTDAGNTWQVIGPAVSQLAIDPANPSILVVVAQGGIQRTTDGGATWHAGGPESSDVRALLFSPADPKSVYLASNKAGDAFVAKLNRAGDKLLYATYFGGHGLDSPNSIAVDANGNATVTGYTQSSDFPVTPGAFQTSPIQGAGAQAFVTKLNANGDGFVFSTFLPGVGPSAVAADAAGNVYVTGSTTSAGFPVTAGAFQTTHPSISPPYTGNAFVTKLSADGSSLVYSTFLGGSVHDVGNGIAVDADGNAVVAGTTSSTDFPVTHGALKTATSTAGNSFVTKLNATGDGLIYSTFLGGTGFGVATAIALDGAGNAYITGSAGSPDFPVTAGAYQPRLSSSLCFYPLSCQPGCIGPSLGFEPPADVFLTKLSPDGSSLLFSTYVGGECPARATGVAVDPQGRAYFAASTLARRFPMVAPVESAGVCGDFNTVAGELSATARAFCSRPIWTRVNRPPSRSIPPPPGTWAARRARRRWSCRLRRRPPIPTARTRTW